MSYDSITLILTIIIILFPYCSKLEECYITSLLGLNIFALQTNMFYIHILATQMRIIFWKSNHNKFIGIDVYTPKHAAYRNLILHPACICFQLQ